MSTPLWRESIESALSADRFDLEDWQMATQSLPQLERDDRRAADEFCGHPVQDSFLSLFKTAPRLADPVAPRLTPLADLLQRGMQTPEWARLRESALGDHIAAGVGASAFVEETLRALPEEVKEAAREQAESQAQADEWQQQATALTDLLDALREHYGEAVPPEAAQQIEEIQQQAENAQRLTNLDAEIRAHIFERDALDIHVRLAQNAVRTTLRTIGSSIGCAMKATAATPWRSATVR